MINLLPSNHISLVKKWRVLRMIASSMVALIILIALGAILLVPTLFTINSRYELARERISILEKSGAIASPVDIASFESRTNALAEKLAAPEAASPAAYVALAKELAGTGITPSGFSLENMKDKELSVHGIARTRENLQSYIRALEGSEKVQIVDSPISNYVASSNIEFLISITFK